MSDPTSVPDLITRLKEWVQDTERSHAVDRGYESQQHLEDVESVVQMLEAPAAVEVTYSERGFAQYEPMVCSYGTTVRLAESSAAFVDRLWLFLDGLTGPGQANHDSAPGESAAHLTYENAVQLRDQLSAWIATHEDTEEQNDG